MPEPEPPALAEPLRSRFTMSLGMLGMFLTILWIAVFFVALALAYFFIMQDRPALQRVHMPIWLWLSTFLLAVSSVTLQVARASLRVARFTAYRKELLLTVAIGCMFLVTQLLGGWDLLRQGVYMEGNPHGSVYFSFTGIHALHLVGGLGGMLWLLKRAAFLADGEEQPLRRHRMLARNVAVYWHFMGGLWIGLFALLLVWS